MRQSITQDYVQACIPNRDLTAHKFENGFLTSFVGSRQYPGAARLSCHAAARSGAGGVYALLPESLWPIISAIPAEVMPIMLKEHEGSLSIVDALEKFLLAVERSSAVLIGCGIGRHVSAHNLIKGMLSATELPCIIDGDGLFILGQLGEEFLITQSRKKWVLTPHVGEWAHLMRSFGHDIRANPQDLAQKWGCAILLKGFPSLVYDPHGRVYENTTGNPAATTAGCGDVLAGIISGYLAQGLDPIQAACVGIFQAGEIADRLIATTGRHSLMASDILCGF